MRLDIRFLLLLLCQKALLVLHLAWPVSMSVLTETIHDAVVIKGWQSRMLSTTTLGVPASCWKESFRPAMC